MNRPLPDKVVLGLLKAQPAHGYELLECFRSQSQLGWIWTMSTSQLYAVLKRLETEGAIIGEEISSSNAPPRTEYSITPLGNQLLECWLAEPHPSASIHQIRVLFLSRIFVANILGKSIDRIVKAQVSSCHTQKEIFIARKQRSSSDIEKLTLEFVIGQLNAAIDWIENSPLDLFGDPIIALRKEI